MWENSLSAMKKYKRRQSYIYNNKLDFAFQGGLYRVQFWGGDFEIFQIDDLSTNLVKNSFPDIFSSWWISPFLPLLHGITGLNYYVFQKPSS